MRPPPSHCAMPRRSEVWLKALRQSSPKLLKQIFKLGPLDAILTICEVALNYKRGNYKVSLSKQQTLYAQQLADRIISVQRKRKFLAKPVGIKLVRALLAIKNESSQKNGAGRPELHSNVEKVRR